MNATLRRLRDLATGWRGSDAPVSLNAADAQLLGFDLDRDGGGAVTQHATVKGRDLYQRVMSIPTNQEIDDADDLSTEAQKSQAGPDVGNSGAKTKGTAVPPAPTPAPAPVKPAAPKGGISGKTPPATEPADPLGPIGG